MRLFRIGKGKSRESPKETSTCAHPITHQIALRQDPSHPNVVTAMKCSQCGAVLPIEKSQAA